MDCAETLTGSGVGRWGDHQVEYAFSTVRRTWHARRGGASRSVEGYRLTFQLAGRDADVREFATAAERDAFVSKSIVATPGRVDRGRLLKGCSPGSPVLVGGKIEATRFVADYIEVQVRGLTLMFYEWPTVTVDGSSFDYTDAGYREALTSLVGRVVTAEDTYLDDGIVLELSNAEIVLPADRIRFPRSVEVMAWGPDVIIQAGDVPFD